MRRKSSRGDIKGVRLPPPPAGTAFEEVWSIAKACGELGVLPNSIYQAFKQGRINLYWADGLSMAVVLISEALELKKALKGDDIERGNRVAWDGMGRARRDIRRNAFIYLLECKGSYKIGFTNNMERRTRTIQAALPEPLTVVACFQDANAPQTERRLHRRFAHCRIHGEWFRLSEADVQEFIALAEDKRRPRTQPADQDQPGQDHAERSDGAQ